MSWNKVLDFVIFLKESYLKYFDNLYEYRLNMSLYNSTYDKSRFNYDYSTSLNYWASKLAKDKGIYYFNDVLSCIKITEFNDFVLLRYKSYVDIKKLCLSYLEDCTFNDFWNLYDGLYRDCRSVVINFVEDELVLTPFNKFFNLNEIDETSEDKIRKRIENAKNIEITDKLDGSMQQARYYNGNIVMSSSQALDRDCSWRLNDGFSYMKDNYVELCKDNQDYTFIFEFISKEDAHVVNYDKSMYGLSLLAARNSITGAELDYDDLLYLAYSYNIKITKRFNKTFDNILLELNDKKFDEAEGFVLRIDDYRIKIKYNDYVEMYVILSKTSVNLIIKAIADDRYDDFISKIPVVHRERIEEISNIIYRYINIVEEDINKYYNELFDNNIKQFIINIDKAPKDLRGFLICKFKNQDYNILKSKSGKYKKFEEIENRIWSEHE